MLTAVDFAWTPERPTNNIYKFVYLTPPYKMATPLAAIVDKVQKPAASKCPS